jgi:hypothetical protein
LPNLDAHDPALTIAGAMRVSLDEVERIVL